MVETILAAVVAWSMGMVSNLVMKNDRNVQRTLDALLVLTDKPAAVTSAGMENARRRPKLEKRELAESKKKREDRATHDAMLENIENSTILTPEQEKYLADHTNGI